MDLRTLLAQIQQATQQTTCETLPSTTAQIVCVAQSWQVTIFKNIPNILLALVVLIIAFLLDDRAQRAVERVVGLRNGHRELARLLGRLARGGVLLMALLIVISIFQLTEIVAAFVASLGIAGLVIAFALQDITKNFAAGVLLLILRPFRLDDTIKVKDFEGVVTDISLRATTLRTKDGEEVLVPNADVYSNTITNYTRYMRRRYHVGITLPATVPVEAARQQLESALRQIPEIEHDPEPRVVVTGFGIDTITMDAQYWLSSHAPNAPQIMNQVIGRLHGLVQQLKQPLTEPSEQPAP